MKTGYQKSPFCAIMEEVEKYGHKQKGTDKKSVSGTEESLCSLFRI